MLCSNGTHLTSTIAVHSMSDVEEKIGVLRAQLLRSEQEKELMRIKLEEETAEREKAQKQVCCSVLLRGLRHVYCKCLACCSASQRQL